MYSIYNFIACCKCTVSGMSIIVYNYSGSATLLDLICAWAIMSLHQAALIQDVAVEKFINAAGLKAAGVPYSGTHLRRLEAANLFPRRVRISEHRVAWRESEVIAWQKARIAERDKPKKGRAK
jgi:predicted DNA-binding transcriptional regulator AlpA